MISRWGTSESPQSRADHAKLSTQVKLQAPELVREWLSVDTPSQQLRARTHLERHGVKTPTDTKFTTIGPLTIRQLNIFSHKATLALYFEHFKQPLSNSGRVQAMWSTKEDFFHGIPPELLNLMEQYGTLTQGKWNASETFEYRHDRNTTEGLFGCFARLRGGLFILGFAVADVKTLEDNPDLGGKWIMPRDLLGENPHFDKRL
jgi:hypothetical protein